jgi:hypothetical protein
MFRDAFPAEIVRACRTAGDRFPVRMDQTSLKSQVHREIRGENEPQITQISQMTVVGKEILAPTLTVALTPSLRLVPCESVAQ